MFPLARALWVATLVPAILHSPGPLEAQVHGPSFASAGSQVLAQLDECDWCWDGACHDPQALLLSQHWGPGATGVLPFTQPGCVYGWGNSCSTIIQCEGDTFHSSHARIWEGVTQEDWQAVTREVSYRPELYSIIPGRGLLVSLAPDCAEAPVVALHPVPEGVLAEIGVYVRRMNPSDAPGA
jgi:hypothetical protein